MKTGLIQVADTVCRDLRRRSTKAERLLWERLRNRAIEGVKFRRQHALFHELLGTDTFCVVDFCSAELRLAVELDGNIHDYRREQDGRRESIIGLVGSQGSEIQE